MSGRYEGGFTLIEVVIALTLISISFTTLLEFLSFASSRYEESRKTFDTVLFLDRKLKEKDYEGLEVRREKLPDFPVIEEVIYSYGDLFFVKYERR